MSACYHTQDAILQREGEAAHVILVDWSRGALPSLKNGQVYEQVSDLRLLPFL